MDAYLPSGNSSTGDISVSSDLSIAPKRLQKTGTSYTNKVSRKFGTRSVARRTASTTLSSARKTGLRKQGFKSGL